MLNGKVFLNQHFQEFQLEHLQAQRYTDDVFQSNDKVSYMSSCRPVGEVIIDYSLSLFTKILCKRQASTPNVYTPSFSRLLRLRVMIKELKTQVNVGVGVDVLWKAFGEDLKNILPKMMPNLVKDAEMLEGDGGLASVYLFNFGPGIKTMTYQKERVTEYDESVHRIGLEVIEGGYLDHGFSHYKTTFQLTSTGEQDTLIDITISYESKVEEDTMPSKTTSSTLVFIKYLENYLMNGAT
ncbi:unnamed protein product [Dovyalis caffra]|uniref:Bet v I/Major latex protein domain-containing protein n=1 Tax=Dovyalis caffra TaxID=77055 RepID=A0AAV1R5H4_9ROSI|nr:unnamed protein product [Dovyalis caffra]